MNRTLATSFLYALLCATVLSAGCGSESSSESASPENSSPKPTLTISIQIAPGVSLEMVRLPNGIWMGKTEVTQEQWDAVTGENPSEFKGSDNPVECVSWDDCQEFLRKFNALPSVKDSGLMFRLPTEEEWEYACRAGATGKFCKLADGTEITADTLGRVAWFKDNSDNRMHPVGQKEPNAFGLYDMHGNAWEWTSTADGEGRVGLGGCWSFSARNCESSERDWALPDDRNDCLGFRLCADGRAD